MILEIDIGNSRIKWRLRDDEQILSQDTVDHHDDIDYNKVFAGLKHPPERAIVASVVPRMRSKLDAWFAEYWQLNPVFVEVSRCCAGVTNGYQDIRQMGVDRWLAMVAAYNTLQTACLVINAGSAFTLDLVLLNGQHLGGYIVPSLRLMKDALFRHTDRVKPETIRYDSNLNLGDSTQRAVSSGLQRMHLGLVEQALNQLSEKRSVKPEVVIAGGGAVDLSTLLENYLAQQGKSGCIAGINVRPDLVMDGLSFVGTEPSC